MIDDNSESSERSGRKGTLPTISLGYQMTLSEEVSDFSPDEADRYRTHQFKRATSTADAVLETWDSRPYIEGNETGQSSVDPLSILASFSLSKDRGHKRMEKRLADAMRSKIGLTDKSYNAEIKRYLLHQSAKIHYLLEVQAVTETALSEYIS